MTFDLLRSLCRCKLPLRGRCGSQSMLVCSSDAAAGLPQLGTNYQRKTRACLPCRLRALVQDALAKHLTDSAAFFADKLVALGGGQPADVYLLAQVHLLHLPPSELGSSQHHGCRTTYTPIERF